MWCSKTLVLVSLSVVMFQTGITNGQQQQQPNNNVGFVHPIATDTFPVNHPTVPPSSEQQQQPAEEDLTASTAPSVEPVAAQQQPQFQVPVTLPFVMQRPPKPSSYLRPIIMVDPIVQDEPQPIRQTKPWNLPQVEDLSSPPGVAVTLPIRAKPTSYLRPVFVVDEMLNEDEQTKPSYYVPTRNIAVTLPFDLRPMLTTSNEKTNPVKSKPTSYLRPVIVTDDVPATPEGDYYYGPAEEDLTSPISGTKKKNSVAVTIPFIQQETQPVKATKPASYLRPWFVDDVTPVRSSTKPWSSSRIQEVSPAMTSDDSNIAGYYYQRLRAAGSPVVMMRDPPNSDDARPLLYRRPISVSFTLF